MQPNAPPPNQQPSDPFAFITNAPPSHKPSLLQPGSTKGRIIIVASGVVILLIVFVIFMSVLSGGSKSQAKQYLELGQQQSEIIRLTTLAGDKAKSLETKSYASTIKLSMISSQTELNQVITAHGVSAKELSASLSQSKNTKSDTILDEAEKNGRYDSTFRELIDSQITNYQKQLNSVASSSSGKEKLILQKAFEQAKTIEYKTQGQASL